MAAERPLGAFLYDLSRTSEAVPATQTDELKYLKELGLPVNPEHLHVERIEDVFPYWEKWKGSARDKIDYQLDGVVLKVDSLAEQDMLAYTARRLASPLLQVPPEQVHTVIEDITLQVGRTGDSLP